MFRWLRVPPPKPVTVRDLISRKQGAHNMWDVPLGGRKSFLSFLIDGRETVVVRVAGVARCRLPRPSGEAPWSEGEFELDGQLWHVVSIWRPGAVPVDYRSLVFVGDVCLWDGRSLETWRSQAPRPKDLYEQRYDEMRPLLGVGAAMYGISYLVQLATVGRSNVWRSPLIWLGVPFAWCAGGLLLTLVARWLLRHPRTNARLRVVILAGLLASFLVLGLFATSAVIWYA